MRIGILKADETPTELLDAHGAYEGFYVRLLAHHGFDFTTFPVFADRFPSSVEDADGWLVTGSRFSANDAFPWIDRLKAFIRELRRKQRPLVGICFGHQVIASALGGQVGPASRGWTVGPVEYVRGDGGPVQRVIAWHQEEVSVRPPESCVIGSSAGGRNDMLRYGNGVLTFQCHPELPSSYARGLLGLHEGHIAKDMADRVANAHDESLQYGEIETEIVAFFKGTSSAKEGQAA